MSGIRYGLILKKKDEPARRIQRSQIFDEDGLEDDDSDDHDVETSAMSKAATVKGPTLPPNFKKPITSNHPVFLNQDDDEAEDDESNDKSVTGRLKVTGPIKGMAFGTGQATRESKACIQKALEEDPQAFAYDELYEDIQSKRAEAKEAGQKVRGASKYVDSLLRSAQLRKIEEQRRIDRKIEKERQAEGEQFDDKETFVTEAYKQKLMERKIFEEQERQEKMMEGNTLCIAI